MSTLKADTVTTKSDNTDLTLTGGGTGVPNLEAGFKVGGTAGVPISGLQVGTDGELITWDASGDPATVAVGTATHVLTSNGAGAAPTFQAAGGGGGAWTYISTVTASNATSADLESQFDSTYDLYLISGIDIHPHTDEPWLYARFGVGGSYTTSGSEYSWSVGGDSPVSGAWADGSGAADFISMIGDTSGGNFTIGNGANEASNFNFYLGNPSGTTYWKNCWWHIAMGNGNADISSASGAGGLVSAAGAAAITSVQFYMSSGNLSGIFRIYGRNNS